MKEMIYIFEGDSCYSNGPHKGMINKYRPKFHEIVYVAQSPFYQESFFVQEYPLDPLSGMIMSFRKTSFAEVPSSEQLSLMIGETQTQTVEA